MRSPLRPTPVYRRGDLPQYDPNDGHCLAGNEVILVKRGTLGVPLGEELVLARLCLQKLDEAHRPCSRSRSFNRSRTARICGFSGAPRASAAPIITDAEPQPEPLKLVIPPRRLAS
jgi:hypothetical protein